MKATNSRPLPPPWWHRQVVVGTGQPIASVLEILPQKHPEAEAAPSQDSEGYHTCAPRAHRVGVPSSPATPRRAGRSPGLTCPPSGVRSLSTSCCSQTGPASSACEEEFSSDALVSQDSELHQRPVRPRGRAGQPQGQEPAGKPQARQGHPFCPAVLPFPWSPRGPGRGWTVSTVRGDVLRTCGNEGPHHLPGSGTTSSSHQTRPSTQTTEHLELCQGVATKQSK